MGGVVMGHVAELGLRLRRECGALLEQVMGYAHGVVVHADEHIVVANDAAARILGASSVDDLVGMHAFAFLDPLQLAVARERLAAITAGRVEPQRYRVRRLDGRTGLVAADVDVCARWPGEPPVLLSHLHDLEALCPHTARDGQSLRLFESAPDPLLVVDEQGRLRLVNQAAEDFFGADAKTLQRLQVEDLLPRAFRASHPGLRDGFWRSPRRRLMSGERSLLVQRLDGTEVPVEIGLGPTTFEGAPAVVVTLRDRSARLAAERALSESEARFHGLFTGASVAFLLCDAAERILDVNPAGCALTGRGTDDLVGRAMSELTVTSTADPPIDLGALQVGAPLTALRRLRRADGAVLPVEITASALQNGLRLCIVRDLSAQALADDALRQATRLDAVGRLAGGVAHDFNNLLTVILALTGELEELVAQTPEALTLVREVRDAGDRAAELTRQLLTFARKQPTNPRIVDVGAIARGFSRILRRTVGEDIDLRMELSADALTVLIDPVHVEQVLLNLVVNARDAMQGRGRLTVRAWRARTGEVCLQVDDAGSGIPDVVRAHLFEPFYTTNSVGKGTGLGLATVYGIVKQARGDISVPRSDATGTTFLIELPFADPRDEARSIVPALRRRGQEVALVVEDDPTVRPVLVRILQGAGYRVFNAGNFDDAVSLGRELPRLDILITDVVMPREGGMRVAEELRATHPCLAVLFVSGYAQDVEALASMGRLLAKPFTAEALLTAAQRTLEGY